MLEAKETRKEESKRGEKREKIDPHPDASAAQLS
jgi:hypothetical protein